MYDAKYKKQLMGMSPTLHDDGKDIEKFSYNGMMLGLSFNFCF